jgi:multidrug efflux pump subunit AcrB
VSLNTGQHEKFITSDGGGQYKSIVFDENVKNIEIVERELTQLAEKNNFIVEFSGRYYESKGQLRQLWFIFGVVLLLLYFILAIQYENLVQPLVVMATIPLGITGGMGLLWITGGSLDVMAAIGFVVILGLIVDDPILKIETLNRLEKQYREQGLKHDDHLLERMIHEAGDRCLKPLLMVSLTTTIALLPVLFLGGIGNELQRPLAIVIIGGLTLGTFFTTWFIPLAYWYVSKWKINRK